MFILLLIIQGIALHVLVNKIRPFDNPSETYSYYSLKFCQPDQLEYADQTLGQSLSGDQKMNSLYHFTENTTYQLICNQNISTNDIKQFKMAIDESYYAEFYIGDIIMHDNIGIKSNNTHYLKNHIQFNIYYDDDRKFLHSNISTQDKDYIEISSELQQIPFYFSAQFIQNDQIVENDPFDKQDVISFKWMLILIKGILIIILTSVVCYLFRRMLHKDFIQLADDEDGIEPIGWKCVRVEALMPPSNKILFSAFLGNGIQFILSLCIILLLGSFEIFEQHRGSIKSMSIIIYSFLGCMNIILIIVFNGYYSGKLYKFFNGKSWMLNLLITIIFFPISIASTTFIVNAIAWLWGITFIHFDSFVSIAFIMTVVYFPLTLIGGVAGRLRTIDQLPEKRKKKNVPLSFKQQLIYGIIPFLSVIVEINLIFQSTWGHYQFHQYLLLLFSFIQLLIIVGCIAIILTYKQLNQQDYNWHWASFINGGSTALYIFIYCCFYFYFTNMHGFLQFVFYFTQSILSCLIIWTILGTISYLLSLRFVIFIYSSNKMQ